MLLSIRQKISVFACVIATAALGIDFGMAGKPAKASIVDLSCTGAYAASYTPGLTITPKTTTAENETTLTCSPLIANSTIISGSAKGTYMVTASCSLATQGPIDVTYYWSDGQYSKVHVIPDANEKPAGDTVVTATGLVTEGEFKNDTVTVTASSATLNSAECLSTGVTNASGVQTITLVRP